MATADRNGRAAEAHGQPRGEAGSPHSTHSSHPCRPNAAPPERPLKSKDHFKGVWTNPLQLGSLQNYLFCARFVTQEEEESLRAPGCSPPHQAAAAPRRTVPPPQHRGLQRARPSIGAERFAQHPQGNKAFETYRFLNGLYGFSISFAC